MARTVQDCATLLEVIAGNDGIDDRQPYNWPQGHLKFGEKLKNFLDSSVAETPLKGIKVGILVEGFPSSMTDPNVASASRSAISRLAELGAEVKEVSIPFYKDSGLVWMVGMAMVRIPIWSHEICRLHLDLPKRCSSRRTLTCLSIARHNSKPPLKPLGQEATSVPRPLRALRLNLNPRSLRRPRTRRSERLPAWPLPPRTIR